MDISSWSAQQLAEEQAALRRVAILVAQGEPPAGVFGAVAEETGRLLGADLVTIGRYDPDDTLIVVAPWSAAGTRYRSACRGRSGGSAWRGW